jgi:hypothetical protein
MFQLESSLEGMNIVNVLLWRGSFHPDYEELQRRGHVLAEDLALRDQYEDSEPDNSLEPGFNTWDQAKRRSSAVSGMSVLALE